MAPKKPFKVHSLNKHVEDTQKGISAESQYNRRAATTAALKKDASALDPNVFANNDEESNSDSDDSSDDEDQSAFLRKLGAVSSAPKKSATAMKKEIANSDIERVAATAKKAEPAKPATKPATSTSASDDGSSSESDSSSEDEAEDDKKTKPKTNGTAVATATTTATSSASSSEEEDSSDDDASNVNGVKLSNPKAAQQSSSESESESDSDGSASESESEPETAKKPTANGMATIASTSTSDTSSESESEDESDQSTKKTISQANKPQAKAVPAKKSVPAVSDSGSDQSSSEDDANAAVDESMHISDREEAGQLAGPKFIAPDFMIRRGDKEVNGKDVAEVCNQANLQGKQFWYFTVPSDIPISVVQNMEIPLDTAQRGDSVFSHNGDSYGVSFDNMTPKSTIQILIPSADGNKYQAAPRALDQVVQIKRITNLGGSSTGTADPSYQRPVRPQPKGLKARYKPIGVSNSLGNIGSDSEGDEADTEMADAPGLPILPGPSSSTAEPAKEKKKKRKSKAADDGEVVADTPKKGKKSKDSADADSTRAGKRKLTSSEEDAVAASSQLMGESQIAESKTKKQKTDRAGSPDLSTKVTPVTVPVPGFSFSDLPAPDNSTPKGATKKTSSKKKADKLAATEALENGASTPTTKKTTGTKKSESKAEVPPSSQPAISRNTPIAPPVIYGQPLPSSSAPAPVSTPTPAAKVKKASKKKDAKDATQAKP